MAAGGVTCLLLRIPVISPGESRSRMEARGFGVQEAATSSLPFSPSHLSPLSGWLQSPPGEVWREKSPSADRVQPCRGSWGILSGWGGGSPQLMVWTSVSVLGALPWLLSALSDVYSSVYLSFLPSLSLCAAPRFFLSSFFKN